MELRQRHDAVLIATGVYKARDIAAPGVGLPGIAAALDYLTASNRHGWATRCRRSTPGALDARASTSW
jgi:glutamate synthase (NADPH/NADH) small chain